MVLQLPGFVPARRLCHAGLPPPDACCLRFRQFSLPPRLRTFSGLLRVLLLRISIACTAPPPAYACACLFRACGSLYCRRCPSYARYITFVPFRRSFSFATARHHTYTTAATFCTYILPAALPRCLNHAAWTACHSLRSASLPGCHVYRSTHRNACRVTLPAVPVLRAPPPVPACQDSGLFAYLTSLILFSISPISISPQSLNSRQGQRGQGGFISVRISLKNFFL